MILRHLFIIARLCDAYAILVFQDLCTNCKSHTSVSFALVFPNCTPSLEISILIHC